MPPALNARTLEYSVSWFYRKGLAGRLGRHRCFCPSCLTLRYMSFFSKTITEAGKCRHQSSRTRVVELERSRNWRGRDWGGGVTGEGGRQLRFWLREGQKFYLSNPSICIDNNPPKRLVIKNLKHAVHKGSLEILKRFLILGLGEWKLRWKVRGKGTSK